MRATTSRPPRSIIASPCTRAISPQVLPTLDPGYDLAFFDGHTPVPALHTALRKLLRTGGTLITANLNHGGTADAVSQGVVRRQILAQRAGRRGRRNRDQRQAVTVT